MSQARRSSYCARRRRGGLDWRRRRASFGQMVRISHAPSSLSRPANYSETYNDADDASQPASNGTKGKPDLNHGDGDVRGITSCWAYHCSHRRSRSAIRRAHFWTLDDGTGSALPPRCISPFIWLMDQTKRGLSCSWIQSLRLASGEWDPAATTLASRLLCSSSKMPVKPHRDQLRFT